MPGVQGGGVFYCDQVVGRGWKGVDGILFFQDAAKNPGESERGWGCQLMVILREWVVMFCTLCGRLRLALRFVSAVV